MIFYRYVDRPYYNEIKLEKLYLVRETEKGYWISYDRHYKEENEKLDTFVWANTEKKRWISKTSRKRYAYPTKKEALNSYIIRKYRQVEILEARLEKARILHAVAIRLRDNKSESKPTTSPFDNLDRSKLFRADNIA